MKPGDLATGIAKFGDAGSHTRTGSSNNITTSPAHCPFGIHNHGSGQLSGAGRCLLAGGVC